MDDLISIIVPVYNVEKYLGKCVQSIVDQTYTNLEIILVDDGSPDNCPQMCDEWAKKDNRIKVIHKENGGVSSARNMGLDIAKGKYVNFIDSDDFVSCDLIKMLYSNISQNDDLVICCMTSNTTQLQECKNDIKIYEYTSEYIINETTDRKLNKNIDVHKIDGTKVNLTSPWGKLYNLNAILKSNIRFPIGVLYSEDWIFNLIYLSKISRVIILDWYGYFYYKNNDSITSSLEDNRNSEKFIQSQLEIEKILKNMEKDIPSLINNKHNRKINDCLNKLFSLNGKSNLEKKKEVKILAINLENELNSDDEGSYFAHHKFGIIIRDKIFKYTKEHKYNRLLWVLNFYFWVNKMLKTI